MLRRTLSTTTMLTKLEPFSLVMGNYNGELLHQLYINVHTKMNYTQNIKD